ncbi:MAG: O-antigen ligase family protein [Patescibacteria group bacterium]
MPAPYLKILSYVVKVGLLFLPLIAFIVSATMFFPYITGKNFAFRVIVEILLGLWIILAIFKREYRPATSPILYAVAITVLILSAAAMFGENPYRSFWSNYERMEGVVGHLHLFAYFLVLISVFKSIDDWKKMFYSLAATGAAMAVYGYAQFAGLIAISQQSGPRVDGTFGNATYMAIFMMFQAFLAIYLFLRAENRYWKILWAALFAIEAPVIFLTATRGAILGFAGGIILLVFLLSIFSQNRRAKFGAMGVIAGIAFLGGAFWLMRDTDFVKSNYVLSRFSGLSLHERTVESRFTIWGMSWEGFKERPLLGWGPENYNIVFNKYYDPKLWRQEPWFDRSHNVIFDWLITGGVLGLLAYLSIFGSALSMLWARYARERAVVGSVFAPAVFTSMFAAYFFHNLFVFDNLVSYYLFFTFLGFIHFYNATTDHEEADGRLQAGKIAFWQVMAATLVLFSMPVVMYFANAKPIQASRALLNALRDLNQQGSNVDLILKDFDKVFAYSTFGNGEAREQLSGYANNVVKSSLSNENKLRVLNKAIEEVSDQVNDNPYDARAYIVLASLYGSGGKTAEAIAFLNKALEVAPRKQQIYFLLADIYRSSGDAEKALEAAKTAYDLDTNFEQAAMVFAMFNIVNGKQDEADAILMRTFGSILLPNAQMVTAYALAGRYDRVRDTWLMLIESEPSNVQYRVSLAATYVQLKDYAKAIEALARAVDIDPQFKQEGERLINDIKSGKIQ